MHIKGKQSKSDEFTIINGTLLEKKYKQKQIWVKFILKAIIHIKSIGVMLVQKNQAW